MPPPALPLCVQAQAEQLVLRCQSTKIPSSCPRVLLALARGTPPAVKPVDLAAEKPRSHALLRTPASLSPAPLGPVHKGLLRRTLLSAFLSRRHTNPLHQSFEANQQLHHLPEHPRWAAGRAPGPALPGSHQHQGSGRRGVLRHVLSRNVPQGLQDSAETAKPGEQSQIFYLHSFLLSAFSSVYLQGDYTLLTIRLLLLEL